MIMHAFASVKLTPRTNIMLGEVVTSFMLTALYLQGLASEGGPQVGSTTSRSHFKNKFMKGRLAGG